MMTDTQDSLAIFRKGLEEFITLNEEEWAEFSKHLHISALKKKDHFVIKDKICDHIGFIISGSLRYYHVIDGEEITGYFSFKGEFTSSYKSFLRREPAMNYIQALEQSVLVLISYQHLEEMLKNPLLAYKMERFGRLIAEHYLCFYDDRVTSFITQTPEERYIKLFETGREILKRIPQRYIANFLGITPVSLSRIRKRIIKMPVFAVN